MSDMGHDSKRRKREPHDFTVEVKLRSSSKAARNDEVPGDFPIRQSIWAASVSEDLAEIEKDYSTPTPDGLPANDVAGSFGNTESSDEEDEDDEAMYDYEDDEISDDEAEDDEAMYDYEDDETTYGSEDDVFAEFDWLEQIDGTVKSAGKVIAHCDAKLIRRSQIAHGFYEEMEQPSQETSRLAFGLFDRYGRLQSQLREHPIMKGSGIFQDEFDDGDLLLFELIRVDETHRRKGLASELVTAIIEKARSKSRSFFAVAAPGWLTAEVDRQVRPPSGFRDDWTDEAKDVYEKALKVVQNQAVDMAISFWRKLGFRRVGSSLWFAFAGDATHGSHKIPSDEDYERPEFSGGRLLELYSVPDKEALETMADNELLELISGRLSGLQADDVFWFPTDEWGNNILHLAASRAKILTVAWLVKHNPELRDRYNMEGQTPLDILLAGLEETRTQLQHGMMIEHVSDRFRGHANEAVACLALLRDITPSTTQNLRLRFGCTCSRCLRGFLSPRMQFMLKNVAEVQHDLLAFEVDDGQLFVDWHEETLQFLPAAVRRNLGTNKSMRQGFANLCGHFAACLRRTGIGADGLSAALPTGAHVLEVMRSANEWPPCSRNYLERGGSVHAVGSSIFWSAMQQDEIVGDGSFIEMCLDTSDKDSSVRTEYMSLPKCRNDFE